MIYLRPWSVDAKGDRYQPGIQGGVVDFGALALVMSDKVLTDPGIVDLGKSVDSTLVETRRTMARALRFADEKALDPAPTLAAAVPLAQAKLGTPFMPTQKRHINTWLGNRLVHTTPFKFGVSPETPAVQARLKADYGTYSEAMRPKILGALLLKYPNTTEKDFIPAGLPLIKAAKPSTSYADAFTYADGNLNGKGNWLKGFDRDCVVGTNQVRVYTGGSGSTDYYNVAFSAADMESWINVTTHNDVPAGKSCSGRLYNRLQGATTNGYGGECAKTPGAVNYRMILRFLNSNPTYLSLVSGVSLSVPYELRFRSDGSDHTIYVGGTEYETVSDATYFYLYAGVGGYDRTGVTGYLWMDNWGCTDELVVIPSIMHHRKQQGMS